MPSCLALQMGQFVCSSPTIDPATGEPTNCQPTNTATVNCKVLPGVTCDGPTEFSQTIACRYSGDTKFYTALGLSIFFGAFGIDRFYLGYPGIGLLKLTTCGFFLIGYYVDIFLIATQTVGPADGTYYQIPVNGARLSRVVATDATYRVPMS